MDLSLKTLLLLARETVIDPRKGARIVMNMGLPISTGWLVLLLMAVFSALFTQFTVALMPATEVEMLGGAVSSPIRTAILQWGVMLASVHAVYHIGRWRGGKGALVDAVVLMAWLQFVLLCLQVVQLVSLVILPPLSELLGMVGLALFFWLLTNFIAEMHGFKSLAMTFVAVLICLILAAFALAFVVVLFFGAAG